MRNFSKRVELLGENGRWLGNVPAEHARQLVARKLAAESDKRRGVICAVKLFQAPAPVAPPSKPSLGQYMGQRYTFRVPLTQLIQFTEIHPDDRHLFRLAVTDNLKAVA